MYEAVGREEVRVCVVAVVAFVRDNTGSKRLALVVVDAVRVLIVVAVVVVAVAFAVAAVGVVATKE